MSDEVLGSVLVALLLLLLLAKLLGAVFERLRQPRAIGEIVGGLLLGPTALGWLAPDVERWVFDPAGQGQGALAVFYQLGLVFLMFFAGTEIRSLFHTPQNRLLVSVSAVGVVLPFAVALGFVQAVGPMGYLGSAHHELAFALVFACAIAVTSIPIISRIMHDLGVLRTRFARAVLSVAVLEDLLLYGVIAVAVGLVQGQGPPGTGREGTGPAGWLGVQPGSGPAVAYHILATVTLIVAALALSRTLRRSSPPQAPRPAGGVEASTVYVLLLLGTAALCLALSVELFLGALMAGVVASADAARRGPHAEAALTAIRQFAFSFFIPVYFASVGLKLDLRHEFDLPAFVGLLVFASLVKGASVYLGARIGGWPRAGAVNLSVALNARGGPGIVLATVALEADIISTSFFSCLVLLAVVTSLLAGAWLERVPRAQFEDPCATDPAAEPVAAR